MSAEGQTFVVTKARHRGKRAYHRPGCRHVKRSKYHYNKPAEVVERSPWVPCDRCEPVLVGDVRGSDGGAD